MVQLESNWACFQLYGSIHDSSFYQLYSCCQFNEQRRFLIRGFLSFLEVLQLKSQFVRNLEQEQEPCKCILFRY